MSHTPALVVNSAIPDSLGQIEYILTDKTGTLTKNQMKLRYVAFGDGTVLDLSLNKSSSAMQLEQLFSTFRHGHFAAEKDVKDKRRIDSATDDEQKRSEKFYFLLTLMLCNSVTATTTSPPLITSAIKTTSAAHRAAKFQPFVSLASPPAPKLSPTPSPLQFNIKESLQMKKRSCKLLLIFTFDL